MHEFKSLWASLGPTEKHALAEASGLSYVYLSMVANGHKRAGIQTVSKLTRANPRITPAMLRPDLFGVVHD